MSILEEAKAVLPEVIAWRRYFHENPETGFDLENTVRYVKEKLDEFGIPYVEDPGSKCSVVATIDSGRPGKCIAFRADMDALPVVEETGLPFASKNGKMHACGHDSHTAMLLGTGKILNAHKEEFSGKVKLVFQPAEELGTGSVGIVESGILNDVDEIIGLHVGNVTGEGTVGDIFFKPGPMMATMDKFTLDIVGQGAHGATPQASKDPVVIGSHMVLAIQEIVSREMDPIVPCVITIGEFQSGTAFNIIPGTAHLEGTVRALTEETRAFLKERIGEVAEGVAKTFRASVNYKYFMQPPPLVNDVEVTGRVMASAKTIFPEDVHVLEKPIMGGEDFAWYLEKIPGTFCLLKNPMEIDGRDWPQHNSRFAQEESVLDRGVAVFVNYAMTQLGAE